MTNTFPLGATITLPLWPLHAFKHNGSGFCQIRRDDTAHGVHVERLIPDWYFWDMLAVTDDICSHCLKPFDFDTAGGFDEYGELFCSAACESAWSAPIA